MSEYKIGERVECVAPWYGGPDILTIKKIYQAKYWFMEVPGYINEGDLKPNSSIGYEDAEI